ncbi:MAG: helix-turn-helix domain-containing protein [Opitutaceae bacterium]
MVWQSVCDYLSEHWSDPQLSRKERRCSSTGISNHFSRFFHAHTKQNFRTYVNDIRLERSLHFLRDLRYNVTDVASLCGFTEVHFIRCFRNGLVSHRETTGSATSCRSRCYLFSHSC